MNSLKLEMEAEKCSTSYNARFFLTPECGSCTYHRQKGVAEAESWLGGEVLVRDEADPDLTAFGSVASRYRL